LLYNTRFYSLFAVQRI